MKNQRTNRRLQVLIVAGILAIAGGLVGVFFQYYTIVPRSSEIGTLDDLHELLAVQNVHQVTLTEQSDQLWEYNVEMNEPVNGRSRLQFVAPGPSDATERLISESNAILMYRGRGTPWPMFLAQLLPVLILASVLILVLSLATVVVLRLGSPRAR